MKNNIIVGFLLFALGIAGGVYFGPKSDRGDHKVETAQQTGDYYTCPMHPSVKSDRPGACPVCGMALVKKSAQQDLSESELGDFRSISLSPTQRVLANVSTVKVARENLINSIDAVGVVGYAEPSQATVAARFRGRIEHLTANVTGQKVQKGSPLFGLYSPELVSSQRELLLALKSSGSLTPMQLQLVDASRERLRVHFGLTGTQIDDIERTGEVQSITQFLSPISGTVLRKDVVVGQYVDEGMVLYELADLSRVWVYIDVYEKDLRFIKVGQNVELSTGAYPGETFKGAVTFIDPVVDSDSRTVRIRTEFQNSEERLKPNMFVTARIQYQVNNAMVIPRVSLLSTGKRNVVWMEAAENRFEPRDVVPGVSTQTKIEILKGLREGDVIAATGGYLIDSESALQAPGTVDPHAGHGTEPAGDRATGGEISSDYRILVKGKYSPGVVHVRKGVTTRLNFFRDEEAKCTEELVIEAFGVHRKLPAHETTTIEITPQQAGEFAFTCGMKMLHGRIIVHE